MIFANGFKNALVVIIFILLFGCKDKPDKIAVSIQLNNGNWLIPADTEVEFHDKNLEEYYSKASHLKKVINEMRTEAKKCNGDSILKFKEEIGDEFFSDILNASEKLCEKKNILQIELASKKESDINVLRNKKLEVENESKIVNEKIEMLNKVLGTMMLEYSNTIKEIEELKLESSKLQSAYKGKFYFKGDYYRSLHSGTRVPSSMVVQNVLGAETFSRKIENFQTGKTGIYEFSIPDKDKNGKIVSRYSYVYLYGDSIDDYHSSINRIMEIEVKKGGFLMLGALSLEELESENANNVITENKDALYPKAYYLLKAILKKERESGIGSMRALQAYDFELKDKVMMLDKKIIELESAKTEITSFHGGNSELSDLALNLNHILVKTEEKTTVSYYNSSILGKSRLDAEGNSKIIDGTHYIVVVSKLAPYTTVAWLVDLEKNENESNVIQLNNINSLPPETTLWKEFSLLKNKQKI